MKLGVKTTYFFTFPLRHPFFVKTSVVFYREKLRTFLQGKNYVLFYRENYVLFYIKKLRTFLQGKTTYFFTKNYVLFY